MLALHPPLLRAVLLIQKMVKKKFKINIDRLKELNEEFIETVNGDLNDVIENEATIDELNTKIVDSIMNFS